MIRRIRNTIKKPGKEHLWAFLFTAVSLLIFLYTSPTLSGAGDKNISEFLLSSEKIKPGFFFIQPILASVLRLFNTIAPASWWSIFSVTIMFTGLYIFLWFLNRRCTEYEWSVHVLMSVLFIFFFWELILREPVNFTQTAVISSLAGFSLIADVFFLTEKRKRIRLIAGVLLLLIGGVIRWRAILLMFPFEIMCFVYFWVFPYSSSNIVDSLKISIRDRKEVILLLLVVLAAVASVYAVQKIELTVNPEFKEYAKANSLRASISDYRECYPEYDEDTAEMYEDLGIKPSWLDMVYGFNTSDVNYFSSSDLEKMVALKQPSEMSVSEFTDTLKNHKVLWIIMLTLCVGICILNGWKNSFFPMIGCVMAYLLCALYFVHIGRSQWRVTNGCILAGQLSFMMMSFHPIAEKPKFKIDLSIRTGIIAVSVLFFVVAIAAVDEEKGVWCKPKAQVLEPLDAELLDYMNDNADIVYLYEDEMKFTEAYNLWATHKPDYLDNYFPLVANFIYGCREKLEEYGVYNVYNDMLSMPNVRIPYSVNCTSVFYNYLRDYYDYHTSISVVDEYNGTCFLRYSRPVAPEHETETAIEVTFCDSDLFIYDTFVSSTIAVECTIDSSAMMEYEDFYINVEDLITGEVYTYGMDRSDTVCAAKLLRMMNTWNPENVKVTLLGKDRQGCIFQLSDLSEHFWDFVLLLKEDVG